jgi:hypothetical protein
MLWQTDYSVQYCRFPMSESDTNRDALEQVEKATESEPVAGEDLLESEDLRQQLREAKKPVKDANRRAN